MNKYYDPKQLEPNKLVNIKIAERKHGKKMKTYNVDIQFEQDSLGMGYIVITKDNDRKSLYYLAVSVETLIKLKHWLDNNNT